MRLEMGAALFQLGGGTKKNAEDYYGRKITNAVFADNKLLLTFADGVTVAITDEAQSCCGARYMTTDDNVNELKGKVLKEITVEYKEETTGEYGDTHEIAFLRIVTYDLAFTFETHNEHNGYYGGFGLSIDEVTE